MSESSVCAISETKIVIMGGRDFQNYFGRTVKILDIEAGTLETTIESTGHSFMSLGQTIAEEDGKVLSFVLAGEKLDGYDNKPLALISYTAESNEFTFIPFEPK